MNYADILVQWERVREVQREMDRHLLVRRAMAANGRRSVLCRALLASGCRLLAWGERMARREATRAGSLPPSDAERAWTL